MTPEQEQEIDTILDHLASKMAYPSAGGWPERAGNALRALLADWRRLQEAYDLSHDARHGNSGMCCLLRESERDRANELEADWRRLKDAVDTMTTERTIRDAYVAQVEADWRQLKDAVTKHHAQRADDRCWMDDVELYAAAGLASRSETMFAIGDKAAMLKNCERYVQKRCIEGGPWKSYATLEADWRRRGEALERWERAVGTTLENAEELAASEHAAKETKT